MELPHARIVEKGQLKKSWGWTRFHDSLYSVELNSNVPTCKFTNDLPASLLVCICHAIVFPGNPQSIVGVVHTRDKASPPDSFAIHILVSFANWEHPTEVPKLLGSASLWSVLSSLDFVIVMRSWFQRSFRVCRCSATNEQSGVSFLYDNIGNRHII